MKRIPITFAIAMFLFSIPLTAGTVYFAQVANGGGYATTFTIFNPTSSSASGTLTLRDGNGNPWNMSLTNRNTNYRFAVTVPANGSARLVSSGAGNVAVGWALLESAADLRGVATFDYRPGLELLDSVGVVGASPDNSFIMPIDISPSADEGLAIVNPGTAGVTINITLINEDGSTYSSLADPRLNPLGAKKSLSLYATELFPSLLLGSFKGLLAIQVVGSGNVAVMGLSYKEGQISVIPVIASSGSSGSTSKTKAQQLLGHWIFRYTIISTFTNEYALSSLYEDPEEPGTWYALGTGQYGDDVIAGWSSDLGEYMLLDPGTIINRIFVFNFTSTNSVAGTYYQQDPVDETLSNGYPMTGTRTSTATGLTMSDMSSNAGMQPQSQREISEKFEVQSSKGIFLTPDPIVLRAIQRLKNLR
jgi:hypothetical protein